MSSENQQQLNNRYDNIIKISGGILLASFIATLLTSKNSTPSFISFGIMLTSCIALISAQTLRERNNDPQHCATLSCYV